MSVIDPNPNGSSKVEPVEPWNQGGEIPHSQPEPMTLKTLWKGDVVMGGEGIILYTIFEGF